MIREDKVIIRLNGQIKDEFKKIADEHGMTVSGLGAYIIGQFVRTQRKFVEPLSEAILEGVLQKVEEEMRKPENGRPVTEGDSSERSEAKNP